jgi:SGNH hydrolase-like domain, acetyltransferase AlgX
MFRLVAKLCILATPLAVLVCIELALPIDAFVFRFWEALAVMDRPVDTPLVRIFPYTALPGPFLPQTRMAGVEVGDLGHHTAFAEPHWVSWETDEYGYRTASSSRNPDLVVVGDSTVVGAGLTQEDTLAAVLSREYGVQAYPFAPASLESFLAEQRFRDHPPRFVVVVCIERDVLGVFGEVRPPPQKPRKVQWIRSELLKRAEFTWVRLQRLNVLKYLRAQFNGRPPPMNFGGMLFLQGEKANGSRKSTEILAAAETLARHTAQARARGFQLALLTVPNKETVYGDLLPGAPVARLLPSLHRALAERGVEALDIEGALRQTRQSGTPPFHRDDTHWNATGVRVAAAAIANWIRSHEGAQEEGHL